MAKERPDPWDGGNDDEGPSGSDQRYHQYIARFHAKLVQLRIPVSDTIWNQHVKDSKEKLAYLASTSAHDEKNTLLKESLEAGLQPVKKNNSHTLGLIAALDTQDQLLGESLDSPRTDPFNDVERQASPFFYEAYAVLNNLASGAWHGQPMVIAQRELAKLLYDQNRDTTENIVAGVSVAADLVRKISQLALTAKEECRGSGRGC